MKTSADPTASRRSKRRQHRRNGARCTDAATTNIDRSGVSVPQTLGADAGRFVDLFEASSRLGLTCAAVQSLVEAKQLRGYEMHGQWRLLTCDVERLQIHLFMQRGPTRNDRTVAVARFEVDPWRFRGGKIEDLSGHDGRRLAVTRIRHNGKLENFSVFRGTNCADSSSARPHTRASSSLYELRRRRAKLLSIWRQTDLFSETDMALVMARFNGITASAWARQRGVSRQAGYERLGRIRDRARSVNLVGWRQL